MQNLTVNLTPTANAKPAQESNSNATTPFDTGIDTLGLASKKQFAHVLNQQLTLQRKLQQANVTEPLADSKLDVQQAIALDEALLDGTLDVVAPNDETTQALTTQDTTAQAPLQDMLLMQMQMPMAVNTAMTAIKPTSEGAQTTDSPEVTLAPPSEAAAAPILNGETTVKNSAPGLVPTQPQDLAGSQRPSLTEMAGRDMPVPREQPELVVNKPTEPVFKDSLNNATTALANQPIQAFNKAEATNATQTVANTYNVSQTFGKAEWNQAVHQRVVWMVGAGEQSATLTLNPPELGPLKVVVQVDNQFVNTTFTSEDANVRQALEDGMQMLREKMQESGIQLGNAHVNSGSQSERDAQQAANQSQRQRTHQASNDAAVTEQAPQTQRYVNRGLVDTFA